jgi:hypothetical protein
MREVRMEIRGALDSQSIRLTLALDRCPPLNQKSGPLYRRILIRTSNLVAWRDSTVSGRAGKSVLA